MSFKSVIKTNARVGNLPEALFPFLTNTLWTASNIQDQFYRSYIEPALCKTTAR
jgi:hypothetical protein